MRDTWELNVMSIDGTMYFEEHLSDEKLREKYVLSSLTSFMHSLVARVYLSFIIHTTGTIYPHITASNHTTATHSNHGVHPPPLLRLNSKLPPKPKLQPQTDGAAT